MLWWPSSRTHLVAIPKLLHPLGQPVDITRFDDETLDAITDDRARCRRDHTWQTTGKCLISNNGRALEERGKHEDIRLRPYGRNVGVRNPPQEFDLIFKGEVGPGFFGRGPEELELPSRSPDAIPGLEQVHETLALGDSPGEQKSAAVVMTLAGQGTKAPTVRGIRHHADLTCGMFRGLKRVLAI